VAALEDQSFAESNIFAPIDIKVDLASRRVRNFGKDLVHNFDNQAWVSDKRYSADTVVKGSKDKFTDLVKNTYRVLLSRGLKGCYVYFMDKDTERFVKSRMEN